jgi:ubiquinol-cytochrome c reductase cytochrome c1 subunit
MLRFILGLIGGIFALAMIGSLFSGLKTYFSNPPAQLASDVFHKEPRELHLASDGPFGSFKHNQAQLQRGFQVYSEVCSACHSLKLVSFRDLKGIGYNDAEIKKIASDWKTQVASINPDTGEASTRKALPSDTFPPPFPNEVAARAANNNALPPDLSLITKAREGGPDYVAGILTGFKDPPSSFKVMEGMYYNEYFPGHQIKMPPPLSPNQVEYADKTPATVPQMAHDVVSFLAWAAEPTLEARHRMGFKVILFLVIATGIFYAAKRKIWSRIQH